MNMFFNELYCLIMSSDKYTTRRKDNYFIQLSTTNESRNSPTIHLISFVLLPIEIERAGKIKL